MTEPQNPETNKPASADCLYSRHKLEETESIRETTAGLAPPEEMDKHQPPGCSISIRNCYYEAVTASKKDSWELRLIDELQETPRQGQVVCGSAPGRGSSWLEESIMDSTLIYKISRTHDIEEPAVNPMPPDKTPKTAMDPYAMSRKPTIYDKRQQNTAGQEKGGSGDNVELKSGIDSELSKARKVTNAREGITGAVEDGRDAAEHKLRPLATKANLGNFIHRSTAATSKQEQVDDADAGGMTAQEGLSRRKVVSNVGSFIKPSDRRNPTFSEHESPLQRLVKGGAPESRAEAGSKPFTVCLELMENVTVRTWGRRKPR